MHGKPNKMYNTMNEEAGQHTKRGQQQKQAKTRRIVGTQTGRGHGARDREDGRRGTCNVASDCGREAFTKVK